MDGDVEMKGQMHSVKLSLERQFSYYYIVILLFCFAIIPIYFWVAGKTSKFFPSSIAIVVGSFFGLLSIWSFLRLKKALRFHRIPSELDAVTKNKIVREILREHKWSYSLNKRNYLEATGNGFRDKIDLRTESQRLIILIDKEGIMINSICDPDGASQQAYSFGKNKQNIKDFELLFLQKTYSLAEIKNKDQA